jgi:hypothetical protein
VDSAAAAAKCTELAQALAGRCGTVTTPSFDPQRLTISAWPAAVHNFETA